MRRRHSGRNIFRDESLPPLDGKNSLDVDLGKRVGHVVLPGFIIGAFRPHGTCSSIYRVSNEHCAPLRRVVGPKEEFNRGTATASSSPVGTRCL